MSITIYKELDEQYSIPEYYKLSSILISLNVSFLVFENALKVYTFNLNSTKRNSDFSTVSSISEWLNYHDLRVFKILYQVPFDLLPLHINDDDIESSLAAWRLEIGK